MSQPIIWHCVFCGNHWSADKLPFHKPTGAPWCPHCKEYKGLEVCVPPCICDDEEAIEAAALDAHTILTPQQLLAEARARRSKQ